MSSLVLGGDDALERDRFYLDYKKDFDKVVLIDLPEENSLRAKLSNLGFFEERQLFVFKNIFLNQVKMGKVSAKIESLLKLLQSYTEQSLLFLEDDLNKIKYYKKYLPKAVVKEFRISQTLFSFLDNFRPHNLARCYQLWQKSKVQNAPELVFHMLKRRLRELIGIKNKSLKGNYQPWQLGKLKGQAGEWEQKKLLLIYKALYNYEKGLKSGTNPLSTEQAIEVIISLYL